MIRYRLLLLAASITFLVSSNLRAETKITVNRNEGAQATPAFKFKDVPTPAKDGAPADARFTVIDGKRDENGADIDAIHDGKLPTEEDQPEINIVCKGDAPKALPSVLKVEAGDGKYQVTIDTTDTPDLTEWADTELAPVVKEWYPKIVAMLPSDGYEAPKSFSIKFDKDMKGVAYTQGTAIHCAAAWYRNELKREGKGSIVHEMVHVVQQYGHAHKSHATQAPGWLVEGIPDYIRWYLYEPQSHGADMNKRSLARAHFDGSYRVSANFLNYVVTKYDKDLIKKLNVPLREGAYDSAIWKTLTGKTVDELNDEWKESLAK